MTVAERPLWQVPAVRYWALANANALLAATAPTRPWGWTGGVSAAFALLFLALAVREGRGALTWRGWVAAGAAAVGIAALVRLVARL